MKVKRGLIIFPGALGDLVCLVPTIRVLATRYPEISFELMARAELARIAVGRTAIAAGHSIDRHEVAQLFSPQGSQSREARIFFSQFVRVDCFFAATSEHFCDSLTDAAGGDVAFYPFRPPGPGHVAECYLRAINAPISQPLCYWIDLMAEDLSCARQRLQASRLEPDSFLLILPGSGSVKKNWPAENFAALAQSAAKLTAATKDDHGLGHSRAQASATRVLVVLGPAEATLAPIFIEQRFAVFDDLELAEVAGLARMARCFVGNDSGVSHLAASSGARGLVIFGPTEPERWRPLGDVQVIRKEPLQDLAPDEVWPVVANLLAVGSPDRKK
jgi:heptosyltransferase-2